MSWNRRNEDNRSSGSGLATGLVAAGGIAAAGFLLYKMFSDNKPEKPQPTASNSFQRRDSNTSWSDFDLQRTINEVENGVENLGNIRDASVTVVGKTKMNRSICTKCYVNKEDVVLGPCNHSVCENCAEKIDNNCPFCYKVVATMKPSYL